MSKVDAAGLRRVLSVDAVGVGALASAAVIAALRDSRSPDARGLAQVAAVGLAGLGLAVAAVGRVGGLVGVRGALPHPDAVAVSSARRLIAAGLTLNTIGTTVVVGRRRPGAAAAVAAIVLLVGGDVLSALYLKRLRRDRSSWPSPRPRCVPSARRP
jgi:hypothetical protein